MYQSVNYKEDIARRLLKLLMISRVNQIPISVLDRLKWELGLPQDYEKAIIPEFPDYFRMIGDKMLGGNGKVLELVYWSDEFAVSEIEKKGSNGGNVQFTLQYSTGFEMDKKYKKWVDQWQKLPYRSPYENAMHLDTKSDESDKWAVAVLHEVLSLFVGKKAEKESLLYFGECLGLRSRFKRAFLQHPGIFYVSSKIGTYTVVLREAYRRGMLVERHPLMDMRYKYVQLMNVVKDAEKMKYIQQKSGSDVKEGREELKVIDDGEEDNVEMYDSSDGCESDDCEDRIHGGNANRRQGRFKRNGAFEDRNSERLAKNSNGRFKEKDEFKSSRGNGRIKEKDEFKSSTRISRRTNTRDNERYKDKDEFRGSTRFSRRTNARDGKRFKDKDDFISSARFSRRTNTRDGDQNVSWLSPPNLKLSSNKAQSV